MVSIEDKCPEETQVSDLQVHECNQTEERKKTGKKRKRKCMEESLGGVEVTVMVEPTRQPGYLLVRGCA